MGVNEVQGAHQSQPTRREVTKKVGNETIKCIWMDTDPNKDGLELLSVTMTDSNKHEIAYFDFDGDGYFDMTVRKSPNNAVPIKTPNTEKTEATKMENLVPKEDVAGSVSNAKAVTEKFKNEIFSKLDTSKSTKTAKIIKDYLDELVEYAQEMNGVIKNNLKPNGTPEQNRMYYLRIPEAIRNMELLAEFIGSGLTLVKDSETGLYKLRIDNKLYDIPERKVEIGIFETDEMDELRPKIVD